MLGKQFLQFYNSHEIYSRVILIKSSLVELVTLMRNNLLFTYNQIHEIFLRVWIRLCKDYLSKSSVKRNFFLVILRSFLNLCSVRKRYQSFDLIALFDGKRWSFYCSALTLANCSRSRDPSNLKFNADALAIWQATFLRSERRLSPRWFVGYRFQRYKLVGDIKAIPRAFDASPAKFPAFNTFVSNYHRLLQGKVKRFPCKYPWAPVWCYSLQHYYHTYFSDVGWHEINLFR